MNRHLDPPLSWPEQMRTTLATLGMACASLDIWLEMASAETRPQNLDAMNEYSEFFRFVELCHLRVAALELHILHDKAGGTISLASLLKGAPLEKAEKLRLGKALEELRPIAEKVKVLRDKLFAHRDAKYTWKDAWKAANLKRNEIEKLLNDSIKLYNSIAKATSSPIFSQHDYVRIELKSLFRDIDKLRASKLFPAE